MTPTTLRSTVNVRGRGSDRAETRRRLLEAAGAVFAERGFEGASLEEIAARSGFTRGAIYRNFDSKDDLFLALIEEENRAAAVGVAAALGTGHTFLETALSDPVPPDERRRSDLVRFEFYLYCARRPEMAARLKQLSRDRITALAEVIRSEAQERGLTLRVSAEEAARLTLAVTTQLGLERVMSLNDSRRDLFETLFRLVGLLE